MKINIVVCKLFLLGASIPLLGSANTIKKDDVKRCELPRGYSCYQTKKSLKIDGLAREEAWKNASWTEFFRDIEGLNKSYPTYKARAKMLWDDKYFYVYAELREPHIWASITEHNAVIYHDNDFEVFIDPDGDSENYHEFEVNALNTVWNLLLDKTYDAGAHPKNMNYKAQKSAVHINGTLNDPSDIDRGWTVECRFAWKDMAKLANRPTPPKNNHQWRVNFSRVEWDVTDANGKYNKLSGAEHNWVWSPQGVVAMHIPKHWGYVRFVEQELPKNSDVLEPAYQLLRKLHNAQQLFFMDNKKFSNNLNELGIKKLVSAKIANKLTMIISEDDYVISLNISKDDKPLVLSISKNAEFKTRVK